MKKLIAFLMILCMLPGIGALAESDTLVVYFSCTGTTQGVAERLANVTGADLYEIVPAEPYTDEDLNYNDRSTRATWEQDHPDTRPEIEGLKPIRVSKFFPEGKTADGQIEDLSAAPRSEDIDLTGYDTIYLGYPIWWGMEPRILCTFVEQYDFTGKTVVPFCTSGGSGIGRSGDELAKLAGTGEWLKGARHSGGISEKKLKTWVKGLNK